MVPLGRLGGIGTRTGSPRLEWGSGSGSGESSLQHWGEPGQPFAGAAPRVLRPRSQTAAPPPPQPPPRGLCVHAPAAGGIGAAQDLSVRAHPGQPFSLGGMSAAMPSPGLLRCVAPL
eukprot:221824-Chlamydomonas_euryale.AAC.1